MCVEITAPVISVSPAGSAVGTTRQVIAGAGLIGGGALSSDITLTLSSQLPNPTGIGVTPTGNGPFQIQAGNQTTLIAKGGGVILDHFADVNNSGTTETDLYSDSTPGSILNTNGDKLSAQYAGTFTGAASASQELRAYFGGTVIFDSGALSIGVATDSWILSVTVIRDSSTSVRCFSFLVTNFTTTAASAKYTTVTGLTLTNPTILKITGQAAGLAGASNQITASAATIEWKSAA